MKETPAADMVISESLGRLRDREFALRNVPSSAEIVLAVSELDLAPSARSFLPTGEDELSFPEPSERDLIDALALVPTSLRSMSVAQRRLIEMARRRGVTWQSIGEQLGLGSAQAAQRRYERLVNLTGKDAAEDILVNWHEDETLDDDREQ